MDTQEIYKQSIEKHKEKDLQGAFNLMQQCVAVEPNNPTFRLNLGLIAYQMAAASDPIRELAYFNVQEAVKLSPDSLQAWIALGEISHNCNKFNEAIAAFTKAISMGDNNPNTCVLLGFSLTRLGRGEEAKKYFRRAVEIDPEFGNAHFMLSTMFTGEDYNPEAQAFHAEKAFTCERPSLTTRTEAIWNAAHGYLALGDYDKGWGYFEARLNHHSMNRGEMLPQERFNKPLWVKQRDTRVLVSHEMGMGDCFLFMRMIPMFKEMYGLDVQFECLPQLLDLVAFNLPGINVIPYGSADETTFDYQLPMMSLPLALGITEPVWNGPYIHAEPHKVLEWQEKLKFDDKVVNLGICWAGGARNYNASNFDTDNKRSLKYEQIEPLMSGGRDRPYRWVSLQVGSKEFPAHPDIKTFSDTAAIMELMDGIVTVDTSVANLAGAMGKKTVLMNRFDTCWRWSEYLKTPWFPTVEDIRQKKMGDWDNVIERVKDAIGNWK